ncbi:MULTISPECIES: recombinase family protein [Bacillus cereus group]|uniref:recombinase family protein n=1 Tax=Bacillus cereus group TaxID=86661 RepID=UPI0021D2446C|nr:MULTISPECIES: recombinase family protein [Bacillus cereus group]MCU5201671.1 recombinase family protein [Bacillus paranthracis]MCU5374699.1 recombinase family protein [Bacillus pacificus]
MIVGYARISTDKQVTDMQEDALKKYGCDKIYREEASGKKKDRPVLAEMINRLKSGDTVVVWKLDRISRNTKHLIELAETFKKKGVKFVSIQDKIDTETPMGFFFFTVMGAIAQLEADTTSERVREGLKSARARGRFGGRKSKDPSKVKLALKMYKDGKYTIAEISEATGLKKTTIYDYLRKEKEEKEKEKE